KTIVPASKPPSDSRHRPRANRQQLPSLQRLTLMDSFPSRPEGGLMRIGRTWLLSAAALFAAATIAAAQTTTGTISGHVVDAQGLALPGVAVTAASPNLQGVRAVTTSENGDYVFTLLPPGAYKVSFELSGFDRQERNVTLAPTQMLPVDVTMGISSITE